MTTRITIHEIKYRTQGTEPDFFSRATLRFFGQTMRSFSVRKQADGRYMITAPMRDNAGRHMGQTVRYFNPKTNGLDRE